MIGVPPVVHDADMLYMLMFFNINTDDMPQRMGTCTQDGSIVVPVHLSDMSIEKQENLVSKLQMGETVSKTFCVSHALSPHLTPENCVHDA